MKIEFSSLAGRPYFAVDEQFTDIHDWFANTVRLLTSGYLIGGLAVGLLLLIALLRKAQKASV